MNTKRKKDESQPMISTLDLEQAYETCGGVKNVLMVPNPPPYRGLFNISIYISKNYQFKTVI